jgi:hypothetical protein
VAEGVGADGDHVGEGQDLGDGRRLRAGRRVEEIGLEGEEDGQAGMGGLEAGMDLPREAGERGPGARCQRRQHVGLDRVGEVVGPEERQQALAVGGERRHHLGVVEAAPVPGGAQGLVALLAAMRRQAVALEGDGRDRQVHQVPPRQRARLALQVRLVAGGVGTALPRFLPGDAVVEVEHRQVAVAPDHGPGVLHGFHAEGVREVGEAQGVGARARRRRRRRGGAGAPAGRG